MFRGIRQWLYDVITSHGIIYRLMPYFRTIIVWLVDHTGGKMTKLECPGGATMNVTEYNGRIFPCFGDVRIAGIKNIKMRHDDVMLCGYPKTGCHWVHEILHMLVKGKAEVSKYGKMVEGMLEYIPHIMLDSLPSPRVLNTHLLYGELPLQVKEKKTKIILTVRSPKDTVVSYYNHTMALAHEYEYNGSFDDFFNLFMSEKMEYGTYFDYLLDWQKALEGQNDNPILVVGYEKLKLNTLESVKEIAKFLNLDISEELACDIVAASDFKKMKAKRTGNKIFRKG